MDLNVMMREQARNGLQAQLDAAVTNGDTEAARKVAADIAKLEVANAPKAPAFTGDDVKAAMEAKASWFGVDPKKSAKAMEFGKDMNLRKFASADAFADAVIKAVDEEFKPAAAAEGDSDPEDDGDEDTEKEKAGAGKDTPKPRRTDGPGEGDANNRTVRRANSGPWTKLADAPAEIQKEIKRSAEKFVPAKAPKEQRDSYVTKALESHYLIHQRKAASGKK